jgi:3-phenylpropionate/trans-cinnamate dioxygenase ferredoxin reductase subunit
VHALIIGASVAGLAAADGLRSQGFTGRVTLVDQEPHLPYDKPPLSKQALRADWDTGRGLLRPETHYEEHGIELLLGRAAVSLDGATRTVELDDTTVLAADHIVLTPGVRARRLPEESMLPGVHPIRNADDSAAVRAALASSSRVVVVGGGFIGAETAAVAAKMGVHVTIVEMLPLPFQHLFGPEVAAALAAWHTTAGVDLVCGVGVDRIEGAGRAERVVLTDGRELDADLVVVGLGAVPAVDWLNGSGVAVDNGIVCDEHGRTSVPGIWAGGDAAAWFDSTSGRHVRIEHWTTAKEHGAAVAHNIAHPGAPAKPAGPVPYFWSDQYGRRLQFLGTSQGHDAVHLVHGGYDGDEFVALYSRGGELIGGLGVAAARHLMKFRPLIAERTPMERVLEPVAEVARA